MHGVSVRVSPPPVISPVSCSALRRIRNKTKCRAKISSSTIEDSRNTACHPPRCCHCGRRGLLGVSLSALLPFRPLSVSAAPPKDPTALIEMVHPSRSDFYEELYAKAMSSGMKGYEREIAGYKGKLFSNLKLKGTKKKVLELGVGTGPNFKYYVDNSDLSIIIGVDPNKQMEKYARSSAATAGLPASNFNFLRGVGEALPVDDDSMDVVIGTLVLCSVKDVDATLRDGTFLRFMQGILDPLQQLVADGCHLTRDTGKQIAGVGFSHVSLNNAFLRSVSLFGPHVYGVACK
ncbi:uncharacterized protein LOC144568599 isoform X2 [Carex rostrata]